MPLSTLRGVLRSCAIHQNADTDAIARSFGTSATTATKALIVLSDFGLVEGDASGWMCSVTGLDRSSSDEAFDAAIRDGLLAYRPFESICEGLVAGESFEEAARHVAVAFHLDSRAEANLRLLVQWGVEIGVITSTDSPALAADLKTAVEAVAAMPIGKVSSVAEARLYVSTVLGRDAFDTLDEVDRGLLATTVTECESDPEASVEASGQALEDYLRELCIANGLKADAGKLSGAGQLGALLRQHNLIHPHHVKLVDSASALRNAKSHKKDKRTVIPWKITSLGARTAFGTTALAVRSIYQWTANGRQML